MSEPAVVEVAVDQPVEGTFSYLVPETLSECLNLGMRVLVPFGRRKVTGYVLGPAKNFDVEKMKSVEACLDDAPVFSEKMLELLRWTAAYYLAPLGGVIKMALPTGINRASTKMIFLNAEADISGLSGDESKILTLLEAKGEMPLVTLKKQLDLPKLFSLLGGLEGRGIVRVETVLKGARTREKKQKYVALSEKSSAGEKISPRSEAILDYLKSKGEVAFSDLLKALKTTSPTVKRLESLGLLRIFDKTVFRDPFSLPTRVDRPSKLTPHQEEALEAIRSASEKGGYAPFLLEGKTGSGKTEVYLQAINATEGGAIVLIPEISLTPQLAARFRDRFGERVAVLHSGLSDGERYDQWRRINEGLCDIVVGARSAIFAPVKGLKIIVVDEEHETSYKQDEGVRYNARDLALVRGKLEEAIVILGSATPSLESMRNAEVGKVVKLCLPERVNKMPLPAVELIDLRKEKDKKSWISERLKTLITENLERGEQILLFLNRRGFTPFVLCKDCGQDFKCKNCSVTLTWHQRKNRLICHYCDFSMKALPVCPKCESNNVDGIGIGTEKVESEIKEAFEGVRVLRMDRDSVKGRGSIDRMINAFERGEADILIGTQMVAKGHHFPGVTLVGVLLADISLNIPDFRAAERTYQLLTQVAGRAGREGKTGRVVVQTYSPEHYAILDSGEAGSEDFYRREIEAREALLFPPYSRMINFRISGTGERGIAEGASRLKETAAWILDREGFSSVEIMGPVPAPLARIKGRFRWQMLLRGAESGPLHRAAGALMDAVRKEPGRYSGVRITPDVDPYSLI